MKYSRGLKVARLRYSLKCDWVYHIVTFCILRNTSLKYLRLCTYVVLLCLSVATPEVD